MYDISTDAGLRMWMMHLIIAIGCCLHDLHNALKWALNPYLEMPKRDLKFIHITTAALRRSFYALMATSHHLVERMEFRDHELDAHCLDVLWTIMNVRDDLRHWLVRTQTMLDPDGVLRCSRRMENDVDLHAQIHNQIKKACSIFVWTRSRMVRLGGCL